MCTSKQQVSCFYFHWVRRKDKAKEHLKKKQHPEEAFKLKISENNLTKYNFRKELPQRARSITSDEDEIVTFTFI